MQILHEWTHNPLLNFVHLVKLSEEIVDNGNEEEEEEDDLELDGYDWFIHGEDVDENDPEYRPV